MNLSLSIIVAAVAVDLILPHDVDVRVGGMSYRINLQPVVTGPMRHGDKLNLANASSRMRCPNGTVPGEIAVSTQLTPLTQAKAIIHETIHIATDCDKRSLPIDEKIAQDVSDVLQSSIGPFVVRELQ
jgi:hypothetical protein